MTDMNRPLYKTIQPEFSARPRPPLHPQSTKSSTKTRTISDLWGDASLKYCQARAKLNKQYGAIVQLAQQEIDSLYQTIEIPEIFQLINESNQQLENLMKIDIDENQFAIDQAAAVERIQSNNRVEPTEELVDEPVSFQVDVKGLLTQSSNQSITQTIKQSVSSVVEKTTIKSKVRSKRALDKDTDTSERDSNASSVADSDQSIDMSISQSNTDAEDAPKPKRSRAKKTKAEEEVEPVKATRSRKKVIEQLAPEGVEEPVRSTRTRARAAKTVEAASEDAPKPKRARRAKKDVDDSTADESSRNNSLQIDDVSSINGAADQSINEISAMSSTASSSYSSQVASPKASPIKAWIDPSLLDHSDQMRLSQLAMSNSFDQSSNQSHNIPQLPAVDELVDHVIIEETVTVTESHSYEISVSSAPPMLPSMSSSAPVNQPTDHSYNQPVNQSAAAAAAAKKAAWQASYLASQEKLAEISKVRVASHEGANEGKSSISSISSIDSLIEQSADSPALLHCLNDRQSHENVQITVVDAMQDDDDVGQENQSMNDDDEHSHTYELHDEPGQSTNQSTQSSQRGSPMDSTDSDNESVDEPESVSFHSYPPQSNNQSNPKRSLSLKGKSAKTSTSELDEKILKAKANKAAIDKQKQQTAASSVAKKQLEAKKKREQAEEDKKKKIEEASTKKNKIQSSMNQTINPAGSSTHMSLPGSIKPKSKTDTIKSKKDIAKTLPTPVAAPSIKPTTSNPSSSQSSNQSSPTVVPALPSMLPPLMSMSSSSSSQSTTYMMPDEKHQSTVTQSCSQPMESKQPPPIPAMAAAAFAAPQPPARPVMAAPSVVPVHTNAKPLVKFHGAVAGAVHNPLIANPSAILKPNINLDNTNHHANTNTNPSTSHTMPYKAPTVNSQFMPPPLPITAPATPDCKAPQTAKSNKSPSYTFTPQTRPRCGLNLGDIDNYEMSDMDEGSDDDDSDMRPRKHIPSWAREPQLTQALKRQAELRIDPDLIFPPIDPHACNLAEIFKHVKRRRRFRERTSSARWDNDALNLAEIQQYRVAMGFRQLKLDE